MEECLQLKKSNCKNCYKCIRNCPVKAIRFSDVQANIIGDECILCGKCFVVCPQNAKQVRNDIPAAQALLASDAPVYASVAPSFVANYDGASIRSMERALKQLGFAGVEETALGATVVKARYDALCALGQSDVILSTCCPTVNLLVQKHYPKAIPYLAPVVSPMQARCLDIKKRFPNAKTVFIGPCISKMAEAEQYPGIVDCVLTFEELSEWLAEAKLTLEPLPGDSKHSKARLFPTAGGILRTMAANSPDYTYMSVDGIENCIDAIQDVLNHKLTKCFIEMSACAGSCVGGPVMGKNRRSPVKEFLAVNRSAGKEDFEVAYPPEAELQKEFPSLAPRSVHIGGAAIEEVLLKLGKSKPEDELNCGSCGYNSCREKAEAVILGKADLTMCLPYLKEKAESFSDNIIRNTPNAILVLSESLEVQQINGAACSLMNISDKRSVLGRQVVCILDPLPFFEVFRGNASIRDKRIYLAEYQKYVDQTVVYDKGYHIIICFMRDVTAEALARINREEISRKTMEVTDKVIEKQMRAVQEIASLLGESTAETKVALTKLKESLSNE
ncbi:MAG TPA: [Fe-Fe] hydrogenase large subunit C-terminal domain-containing protein [Clostridia bacterium]|nr:[Fe-Fe] hydrogenase large subunit C-terminal domain-containing protein [Clostridia bacterium]